MTPPPEPSERDLATLAALADGSLAPAQRAEVEARVAASPELRLLLDEQRRAVHVTDAAAVRAPLSLRERIEDQRRRSAPKPRRRRVGWAVGLTAALGAVAVLVVLALPGGAPGGPTVVQAAGLTSRGPTDLPPPNSNGSRLISVAVDGIRFPYWGDAFGWEAAGLRSDRLEGLVTTVFYDKGGRRIGYTIVSGKALPMPRGARADLRRGTTFRSFPHGRRLIVTWRRAGHTCVLTGDGVPLASLLTLASQS